MNTVDVVSESCDREDLETGMAVGIDTVVECGLIRWHLRLAEGDEDEEAPRLAK